MLSRYHHRINSHWLTIFISKGHLTLGIRAQPGQHTILAQLCLTLHQSVGIVDWRRHQHIGLVAGITKHQALIAGTDIFIFGFVDTLSNIIRLLTNRIEHRTGLAIKADIRTVVANTGNYIANNLLEIDIGIGANFTGNNGHASFDHSLYRDTGVRIIF